MGGNAERNAELLAKTQLFGALDRETLLTLGDKCIERTYKKGQLVFYQGDPADALYVILDGLIKVVVTSEDGDEMVIVTLKSADVFGELALVDGGTRSASAEVVAGGATLLALTRETFLELLRENHTMPEALLRSLGGALRRLTEQTADLVFLDLNGRVAKLLLNLAGSLDSPGSGDEDAVLDLHLTQTDLASMVGGSRQSVNQILHTFERQGYLELQGRAIVLKRVDRLRRRANL